MMMINKILLTLIVLILTSCSLSPGMYMDTKSKKGTEYVSIDSLNVEIEIEKLEDLNLCETKCSIDEPYRIGVGDDINFTVWGYPEIFPVSGISDNTYARRVDSTGKIFSPYIGEMLAQGKTSNTLRDEIALELGRNFNDPQVDIKISFNSQKVYLLGEVTKPQKIQITDIPLSLADALGQASGINTNTGEGGEVYIIRQATESSGPRVIKANLSSPKGFLLANGFLLHDNDIVYVNAKGTTRWNRVISQFFPFSTFLNSIDNLVENN